MTLTFVAWQVRGSFIRFVAARRMMRSAVVRNLPSSFQSFRLLNGRDGMQSNEERHDGSFLFYFLFFIIILWMLCTFFCPSIVKWGKNKMMIIYPIYSSWFSFYWWEARKKIENWAWLMPGWYCFYIVLPPTAPPYPAWMRTFLIIGKKGEKDGAVCRHHTHAHTHRVWKKGKKCRRWNFQPRHKIYIFSQLLFKILPSSRQSTLVNESLSIQKKFVFSFLSFGC